MFTVSRLLVAIKIFSAVGKGMHVHYVYRYIYIYVCISMKARGKQSERRVGGQLTALDMFPRER